MGEKKRKLRLRERVLEQSQYCIYCGGTELATTIDHVPPITIFDLRQRPLGLEFPACKACNAGGRLDELAVSLVSRAYPDSSSKAVSEEMRRRMREVRNNCPGLLEELSLTGEQEQIAVSKATWLESGSGALNCKGPLLHTAIRRFGAKLGFALHFRLFNKPVPPEGAANVWWFTNHCWMSKKMPHRLADLLGPPETLRQGKKNVADQFLYASKGTADGAMSVHYATFRFSFGICSFVAEDASKVRPPEGIEHVTLHRPGWLRNRV